MFCRVALLLLVGAIVMQPPARPSPTSIEQRVAGLVATCRGTLGIAATNLLTGEQIAVHADARFPTASTIKVAVMIEAYHQAAGGALPFDTTLTLRDEDKVGGAGVLSDNTATNLLVGRLGTTRINERLAAYGLTNTKLFRPTFRDGRADVHPELEREFGLGMTTPREMARLMALIANGKAVSPDASSAMLATLRRQQDRAMIPRLLPQRDALQIGNKTGTDAEKHPAPDGTHRHVRGDAAIISGPGLRYVIAIFARQVEDTRRSVENDAVVMAARVSRVIYDHFSVAEK